MFDKVSSINDSSHMLNLIAQKQKALGENLANMDTPGYVRKNVDFSQHLNSSSMNGLENKLTARFGESPIMMESAGVEVNPTDEIIELQKNSMLYSMATRHMASVITELKSAINVGR